MERREDKESSILYIIHLIEPSRMNDILIELTIKRENIYILI